MTEYRLNPRIHAQLEENAPWDLFPGEGDFEDNELEFFLPGRPPEDETAPVFKEEQS